MANVCNLSSDETVTLEFLKTTYVSCFEKKNIMNSNGKIEKEKKKRKRKKLKKIL